MTETTTPTVIPGAEGDFGERLERVRAGARGIVSLRGGAILAAVLVGIVAATLLLDWLFRFDVVQRRILAVPVWLAIAWIAYRLLYRPLQARLSVEKLAVAVERRHPELADRLISAVQFERMRREGRLDASPALVDAVIDQAREAAGRILFEDCLDAERAKKSALLALAPLGIAIVLGVGVPGWAWRTWFARTLLLSSTAEWPRVSGLRVEGHKNFLARGETYSLQVTADLSRPRVPDYVTVHYRFEGDEKWASVEVPAREVVNEETGEVVEVSYRTDEPFKNLIRPVTYYVEGGRGHVNFRTGEPFQNLIRWIAYSPVVGGDDRTPEYSIGLTERPEIESLAFEARYPEYSKGGVETLPSDQEVFDLVHGTTLVLKVRTNKELAWAKLAIETRSGDLEREFRAVGERVYELELPIEESLTERADCEILLLSTEDLQEAEPHRFRIAARPDAVPDVDLVLKWLKGEATYNANLPLWLAVKDDFAVKEARIVYTVRAREGRADEPAIRPLPVRKDGPIEFGKKTIGPALLAGEDGWPIERLGLRTGDRLDFVLSADDFLPVPEGAHTGLSAKISVQIVDASDLIKKLNQRQHAQRQELEKVLDKEKETKYATQDLRDSYDKKKEFSDEELASLAGLERRQRSFLVKLQIVADEFEGMRYEMMYNRLYEPDIYDVLIRDGVVEPLRRLAAREMLDTAHGFADLAANPSEEEVGQRLAAVENALDVIAVELAAVLAKIVRLEKFGEIIVKVKQLYELQRKLLEETKQRHLERVKEIIPGLFEEEEEDKKDEKKND